MTHDRLEEERRRTIGEKILLGFGWFCVAFGVFPLIIPVTALLFGTVFIIAGIIMIYLSGRRVKRLKKKKENPK